MHTWINGQFAARKSVNGHFIVHAAKRIQDRMNSELPPEKGVKLKFSNGWLQKFKQRCTLNSFRLAGEAPAAPEPIGAAAPANVPSSDPVRNLAITNATVLTIKEYLRRFPSKDVWCAREFGHCYKMSPANASMDDMAPGAKSERTRITYLACSNADGSEKVPMVIVG